MGPSHAHSFIVGECATRARSPMSELRLDPVLPQLLKAVLTKLYLGFSIQTAPKGHDEVHYLHCYIEIAPSLRTATSFAHGFKMFQNPILPEEAAALLRAIRVEKERPQCQPA